MPNLPSAKKKAKKDVKRTIKNSIFMSMITRSMKLFQKGNKKVPSLDKAKQTISNIDKAVKNKIMHKNKAARFKSRIMKLISRKK